MEYAWDANRIGLSALRERIEHTDLTPSRAILPAALSGVWAEFERLGLQSVGALRSELKTHKRLTALAEATGVDVETLTVLRRELESYIPKPCALTEYHWLPARELQKLAADGVKDTATLFEIAASPTGRASLLRSTGVDVAVLDALLCLADLARVQWVSPTVARILLEASFGSAAQLAEAEATQLCADFERINTAGGYFQGKIGLRDVQRLIVAARYAAAWA